MKARHWIAAAALGLALGAVPFLRYLHLGHGAAAHADHAPRHGGVLRMIGDHHVELVRRAGRAELHASDARRRPLRIARGSARIDASAPSALSIERDRAWLPLPPGARSLDVELTLEDGSTLSWHFALTPSDR